MLNISEWVATKWKRLNTSYYYRMDVNDLIDVDSWEVVGEYRDPIYNKVKRWFYDYWPRRKLRDLKHWVAHRTYDKYHMVWTGSTPGYADKDAQMAGCIFQLLKDFFEKEEDQEIVKWISKPYQDHRMWEGHNEDHIRNYWEQRQESYSLYLRIKNKQPWDFVKGFDDSELTEILIEIVRIRGHLWT